MGQPRTSIALATAALLGAAAFCAPALAQPGRVPTSPGESIDVPSSRGQHSLTIEAPDAFESRAASPQGAAWRIRARVVVHTSTADSAPIDRALGRSKTIAAARAFSAHADGVSSLPGFWTIDLPSIRAATVLASALRAQPGIVEAFVETKPHVSRGIPNDPGFTNQWFLSNGAHPGADINAIPAWLSGITGLGITVGVVDEGFNVGHPDLAANFDAAASQPDGGFSDHGTSTAGLVGAAAFDAKGGAGVAYNSHIARLYYGFESDNAAAFLFHNEIASVKTNSWGPADIGLIYPMSSIELTALETAVNTGRSGKGEVFVWAAGNGAQNNNDRVDYDGYGSNRFSIAVGAIDNQDRPATYSEPGSPLMLVTTSSYDFAGSGGSGIYTSSGSDITGDGQYTTSFGGTSAASPIAAGVVALMLQANPNLTWRDVEHVLIRTARRVNPGDSGWVANGAGRFVNYQYGFGAIDAGAAVALAPAFATRGPEHAYQDIGNVGLQIPDNNTTGISSSIRIPANLAVERVQVALGAPHPRIGDLRITLTSPSGSTSLLAAPRNDTTTGYNAFTFTSVRHWDERSHGVWTLNIQDVQPGNVGTFTNWKLKIYGGVPACPCDWNGGGLSVQDIFDFINDWFAGAGDFNNDGVQQTQDIFDFLNCWFGGCG